MSEVKKSTSTSILIIVIISIPLGIGVARTLPHSKFVKDYVHKRNAINSLSIFSKIHSDRFEITVNNKSKYPFKDLAIKCSYNSDSGKTLKEAEYKIYKVFLKKSTTTASNFTGDNIPYQTDHIDCTADDLSLMSEEDEVKYYESKI